VVQALAQDQEGGGDVPAMGQLGRRDRHAERARCQLLEQRLDGIARETRVLRGKAGQRSVRCKRFMAWGRVARDTAW